MASQVANNWKELLLYGVPDMDNDTYKIALMEPGFAFSRAAHEEYADISGFELPTLYGYTVGGATLAGVAITNDAVLAAGIVTWNNASWLVALGNLQAAGAIVYASSIVAPDTAPIVGYKDFGGTITTYDGGTYTIANIAFAIQ